MPSLYLPPYTTNGISPHIYDILRTGLGAHLYQNERRWHTGDIERCGQMRAEATRRLAVPASAVAPWGTSLGCRRGPGQLLPLRGSYIVQVRGEARGSQAVNFMLGAGFGSPFFRALSPTLCGVIQIVGIHSPFRPTNEHFVQRLIFCTVCLAQHNVVQKCPHSTFVLVAQFSCLGSGDTYFSEESIGVVFR